MKQSFRLTGIGQLFIAVLLAMALSACMGVKHTGSKINSTYYTDFFIAPGVVQYFIKPLWYKADDDKLSLDFTFRTDSTNSLVRVNLSIITNRVIRENDKLMLHLGQPSKSPCCVMIFSEKRKNKIVYRYSSDFDYATVLQYFENKLYPLLDVAGDTIVFHPSPRSARASKTLITEVFY